MKKALEKLYANEGLRKWAYNASGFRKYGLRKDDILHENAAVEEAIRRLPQRIQQERIFRLIRAAQLEMQQKILPPQEWTRYEEDDFYLTPLVKEVMKEMAEREYYDNL